VNNKLNKINQQDIIMIADLNNYKNYDQRNKINIQLKFKTNYLEIYKCKYNNKLINNKIINKVHKIKFHYKNFNFNLNQKSHHQKLDHF